MTYEKLLLPLLLGVCIGKNHNHNNNVKRHPTNGDNLPQHGLGFHNPRKTTPLIVWHSNDAAVLRPSEGRS